MLVIISDLHLTDGTSGETIRVGAFRAFRERLRDLVYDASWRADGKYKPLEELNLVLLGDILILKWEQTHKYLLCLGLKDLQCHFRPENPGPPHQGCQQNQPGENCYNFP